KEDSDSDEELAGGNVHLVNSMEKWNQETSESNNEGKVMVVNFSAHWCGPCRHIATTYRELADKHPAILFLMVDVDALAEFSTSWGISATPTFFFMRDGKEVDKLVGADKVALEKKIVAIADKEKPSS
ncbi:thioredoxin H-type-like, partial [Andrographis paniculata]|uniref:thioredoxin H-type-like n=1 Tax=Andrographis paniculata TaxID=175694 RepID=UPI0021E96F51